MRSVLGSKFKVQSRRCAFALRRINLATMGLLAISACTVGPDYKPPESTAPAAWREAEQRGVASRPADLAQWWTVFGDPLLDSLVGQASVSNLDLRLAEARIREARGLRALAAAALWPQGNVSGSYSRNRSSANAVGLRTQGAVGAPSSSAILEQNLYRTGFDADWEIDVFGGVRRGIEAADAGIQVSVEDKRDILVSLLGEVAKNYIDLRGAQRSLAVARANLAAQQDTLYLTRVRFQAGLVSDLEVAQAEAQANFTAAQIPTLESTIKQAAYALDILIGSEPGTLSAQLEKPGAIPALPPEVLVGLPSDLLRRRPDIRRAERQFAVATAQIGVATADLYPRFSILGTFGLQSISASDWFTGPSRFWSIGPSIRWPFFDAGRIRANIEVRSAQQEQALTQYEKTLLVALGDVETALVNYANEQNRHAALVDAVAANRRAVELANELYIRGLNSFLNVLDAQRSLFSTESDLAQSEATMAANLVALYKALGGGWEVP
jgi:outer membrane protein, multidrug efflux system